MKKKHIKRAIAFALLSTIVGVGISSSEMLAPESASADSPMYSCSDTSAANQEITQMASLKFSDTVDLQQWIQKRQSFCVTIDIGDTGRYVAIGNVPNIQQLIVNDLTGLVMPSGYAMTPDAATSSRIAAGQPLDQAFKSGFPNPMYQGEAPVITISIGDMVVEDNIFSTIAQKVGSVFGGSIISPPSQQDIQASLRYAAPADYSTKLTTIATIIKSHAAQIEALPKGQCLITAPKCEQEGSYLFSHDILDDLVNLPLNEIREKLAARTGSSFQEVQVSIAALLNIQGTQIERSMPIDTNSLITSDKDLFNGIQDQRVEARPLGSPSYYVSSLFITVSTWFSDWTTSLLSFINWKWVDDSGLFKMLDNGVIKLILAIIASLFIIKLVIMIYKTISDSSSSKAWAGIIGSFLMFMFIAAAAISPAWLENTGKYTISLSSTISQSLVSQLALTNSGSMKNVCGPTPTTECIYRMPLLDTWSNYQFGAGVQSDAMTMDQTDVNDLAGAVPQVDGKTIPNWAYYAASMMDKDDNNVYRTVDHLVAPTINIEKDGKINTNDPYTNNKLGGSIQEASGLGTGMLANLLVFEVWALSLIQVLCFIEIAVILALFVVMTLKGWVDGDIPQPFRIFGMSLIRNMVWPLATAFIIITMLNASKEGGTVLLANQIILFAVLILARKPIMRSKMLPLQSLTETKFGQMTSSRIRRQGRKIANNIRARVRR